jgi:hypothetical protein
MTGCTKPAFHESDAMIRREQMRLAIIGDKI